MYRGILLYFLFTVIFCILPMASTAMADERTVIVPLGGSVGNAATSDGALQKGISWPTPRFSDNSDGTVTDNLTGLVWLKNANCLGYVDWNTALTLCNMLASRTCDLTDSSFSSVLSGYAYWTSSINAYNSTNVWVIFFTDGKTSNIRKSSATMLVWPVRN